MKANATYQNLGTNWLVILNGNEEDIELAFNSFYNHGATSGKLEWNSTFNATFWSTPKKMRTYFFNRLRHISISLEQENFFNRRAGLFIQKYPNKTDGARGHASIVTKMVRRLMFSTVNSQFKEFKSGQRTDWNKKFGMDELGMHEYAVHSPGGNGGSGAETMVSKVWNGS
jgi:hypothetical protein